jgi:hypothetical protein
MCPALGREICPACCGTKRQTEIRCPASCPYLASARTHPPAAVRRQQDQDMAVMAPAITRLSEARQQLFLFTLTLIDRFKGEGLDAAADADVVSAAEALAATYETASRGVIYEHRAERLAAQRMAAGFRGVFEDLAKDRPSGFAIDVAEVLRQVADRVRTVQRLSPSDPRAFLRLAGRMAAQFGAAGEDVQRASGPRPGEQGVSSIILP